MLEGIAKRWKVLSGQNKWQGLLDPLDSDLRRYIIHYGEMAQVGYDAFNWDRKSKYAGDCYYSKRQIFARTGYLKANPFRYNVTKYIYATASIKLPICFIVKSLSKEASRVQTNWMGYIAVATDEGKAMLGRRDIVVAWRGTLQPYEWANDFDFPLESAVSVFPVPETKVVPRIGSGWLDVYTASDSHSPYDTTSAREQVFTFPFIIAFCSGQISYGRLKTFRPASLGHENRLEELWPGQDRSKQKLLNPSHQPYFHLSSFLLMALCLGFGFRYKESSRDC